MAFWDEYKEIGGNFVSGDEKRTMVESGIPFEITGVAERDGKFGPEYALACIIPDPETGDKAERTMTFAKGVGSRDDLCAALQTYLDDGGDPVSCKLEMGGRAVLIRKA